jgi:hypothetical protein
MTKLSRRSRRALVDLMTGHRIPLILLNDLVTKGYVIKDYSGKITIVTDF